MMNVHLEGSRRPRPPSARTIYCDGSHDAAFRPGIDLELSHWVPNLTPARYKADTSTAICLRFVADSSRERGFELAVNNHVDVDGTLALFVLSQPELALAHRTLLVQAAEMGDFQGWGEMPAQRLYQALVLQLHDPAHAQADPLERCERAFALVHAALEGAPLPQADAGIAALQRSLALLQSDQIERTALGERAVHFRFPAHVAASDLARCLAVPRFDADLATSVLLLPQARAKRDEQRLQLISVQAGEGWFHDLLYPGYCWAETPDRWRPPGLLLGDGTYRLDHAPLHQAAAELNAAETRPGRWAVAESMSVFGGLAGRGFPVVLSLLHEGRAAASALAPQDVAQRLAALWESAA
ncbi:MAG TPA: DUF6687 family protein [Burkholderiaceae bacterium]